MRSTATGGGAHASLVEIDGLWSISPANGGPSGSPNDLYFTAGLNDEADGLFGLIRRKHHH